MAWAICTRLLRAVCVSPAAAEGGNEREDLNLG